MPDFLLFVPLLQPAVNYIMIKKIHNIYNRGNKL